MRFTTGLRRPFLPRSGRRRWLAPLIGFAILATPALVLASHQFSDVPDGLRFHDDIGAIADAGVTAGCGDGKYCPDAAVTRGQMAAFLNRLGALSPGRTPVVNADRLDGRTQPRFCRLRRTSRSTKARSSAARRM